MTNPTDPEAVARRMKRGDAKLLARLIATNGGGVRCELIPPAQLKRMIALGLAAFKPVNAKKNENIAGLRYGQVIHGPNSLAVRKIIEQEQGHG